MFNLAGDAYGLNNFADASLEKLEEMKHLLLKQLAETQHRILDGFINYCVPPDFEDIDVSKPNTIEATSTGLVSNAPTGSWRSWNNSLPSLSKR